MSTYTRRDILKIGAAGAALGQAALASKTPKAKVDAPSGSVKCDSRRVANGSPRNPRSDGFPQPVGQQTLSWSIRARPIRRF